MPLFGKRRAKQEEKGTFEQGEFKLYPADLAKELVDRAWSEPGVDLRSRRLFLSWVCGGIAAAEAFLGMPEFGSLWHGGREETLGITRVFTRAMVSRWALRRWRELDDETLSRNLEGAARDVISFFGGADPSALEGFTTTQSQFFADLPGQNEREFVDMDLVVSLAARELGRPLPISLESLTRPIGFIQMINDGWIPFFNDHGASVQAILFLGVAERHMFRLYNDLANVDMQATQPDADGSWQEWGNREDTPIETSEKSS